MEYIFYYSKRVLYAFAMLAMPLIFIAPGPAQSFNISDHQVKPLNVTYKGRLTFLDGTPVYRVNEALRAHLLEYPPGFQKEIEIPQKDKKPFKMKNAPATALTKPTAFNKAGGKRWVDNGPLKDGAFFLTIPYPGKYVLRLDDIDIVPFTASLDGKGGLNIDLPENVALPFNFVIITAPKQDIQAMDMKSGAKKTITADDTGIILIKEPSFHTAYAIVGHGLLPTLDAFVKKNQKEAGKLRYRKITLKPKVPSGRISGQIHNIKTDMYHWLRVSTPVRKGPKYYWILSYSGKSRKSAIKPVSFGGDKNRRFSSVNLYLDDKGKPMLAAGYREKGKKKDSYGIFSIGASLGISPFDDPYYPAYRFKGNTIMGNKWQIPNLIGIPFNEGGGNSITIDCDANYSGNKEAEKAFAKSAGNVLKSFYPQCFDKNYKYSCDENLVPVCMADKDCKKAYPKSPPTEKGTSKASNSSNFSVIFDKEEKVYKFDPEDIFPDPLADLKKVYSSVEITKCTITVGGHSLPYSYQDIPENFGRNCYHDEVIKKTTKTITTKDGKTKKVLGEIKTKRVADEECVKAAKNRMKDLPIRMGFPGEDNSIRQSIDLRDPKREDLRRLDRPINMKEGPYSALKYKGKRVAEFPTRKAAKEKCKSPRSKRAGSKTIYYCEEDFIFNVCPDKYSVSVTDNRVSVNYDAMYKCKGGGPGEGNQINLGAEATGFLPEATSWDTKDYEPSSITVTGTVNDEDGNPIPGATVTLSDLGATAVTDDSGKYKLSVKTEGTKPFKGSWNFVLKGVVGEISVEITLELE